MSLLRLKLGLEHLTRLRRKTRPIPDGLAEFFPEKHRQSNRRQEHDALIGPSLPTFKLFHRLMGSCPLPSHAANNSAAKSEDVQ